MKPTHEEVLEALKDDWESSKLSLAQETITGTHRWGNTMSTVLKEKATGRFYELSYATETSDMSPCPFEEKMYDINEVRPEERRVVEYVGLKE